MPRTLHFGNGNGADFLVLYAENYGSSLDESGNTPPSSGQASGVKDIPHRLSSSKVHHLWPVGMRAACLFYFKLLTPIHVPYGQCLKRTRLC